MALYLYFNEELMSATIGQDKAKVETILKMMKELTETWKQVSESKANAGASTAEGILNIKG